MSLHVSSGQWKHWADYFTNRKEIHERIKEQVEEYEEGWERARCQRDHKMSDEQMERDFRRWSGSELKIEVSVGEDGKYQIQSPR